MVPKIKTDQNLLTEISRRSESAFRDLYSRYSGDLFRYAFALCGTREVAEDILQEVFLKILRLAGRLGHVGNLRNYLLKMVRNTWLSNQQKNSREKLLPSNWEEPFVSSQDSSIEKNEQSLKLNQALRDLPEEQRLVIVLKNYNNLNFREIAELLDLPLQTVASRHRLALLKLKERFGHG